VAAAARHLTEKGAQNVVFRRGDAEAMPFAGGEFDVVTARFAPHHFPVPGQFASEVARVIRPGGRLVMFDNMVPEDDDLDAFMNRFERWRDPSHFRAHRLSDWAAMLERAGLRVEASDPLVRKRYVFAAWTAKQSMPTDERDALGRWLLAAPARCREFFRVTAEDGQVAWLEATFGCIAAVKPAG
jgi:SAM-dependent methyltransferase